VKPSEIRDKSDDELRELEGELRDQLVKLSVAKATQRAHNTAQFSRIKKDIARVKTILRERELGLGGTDSKEAEA
jgi:large subunit ribosomal protein L29